MTTLGVKPGLIRADTIDLQPHDHPSAKDHSGGQYHAGYSQTGPHHAQTLRNASQDAMQEQQQSPRLGGFSQPHNGINGQSHLYDDDDDDDDDDQLDHHHMTGQHDDGYGDEDGDSQDEDMDDDLMDKISSSPSIEDGMTTSNSVDSISRYLLPQDDPFLDISEDVECMITEDEADWMDEDDLNNSDDSSAADYDDEQDGLDFSLGADSRFIDSGWGGECLREIEDIDFEFVYALHTFVATVEGQANATKGDTMVLLDDSNSYWWLVRVVKDGSIGYLPAEHIETPIARLARLNKHRNIDLAAAMLGDNPEKSKNPLKKAMRRRNAKTVNFGPPTYYEPDEQVWSDEEEDEGEDHLHHGAASQQDQASSQQSTQSGQQARSVEANDQQRASAAAATIHTVDASDDEDDEPSSPTKSDAQGSAGLSSGNDANSRSRNGTLRNTDSFYQEQETKKISLTPRLLRNDDTGAPQEQEAKERASLDTFEKIAADEKAKDGKKKEKKGMLSGLFKRKDKSGKGSKGDDEPDRTSEDSGRSPMSKDSMESDTTPERKPSKLQKSQPGSVSSIRSSSSDTRTASKDPSIASPTLQQQQFQQQQQQQQQQPQQGSTPPQQSQPAPSATPATQDQQQAFASTADNTLPEQSSAPPLAQEKEKRSVFAPITGALRSKNSSQDMGDSRKPVYAKRSKERFAIDDSDSDGDSTPTTQSTAMLHRSISPLAHGEAQPNRPQSHRVSPIQSQEPEFPHPSSQTIPSAETNIKSAPTHGEHEPFEQEAAPSETPTSPSEHTASTSKRSPSIPAHTPSTSRSTPTWSDASLRTYMDTNQDIRDLLVIVHDKTNVMPVGPEHPLMSGLFATEKTKLADMEKQLDSMLMQWLAKKNRSTTKV